MDEGGVELKRNTVLRSECGDLECDVLDKGRGMVKVVKAGPPPSRSVN